MSIQFYCFTACEMELYFPIQDNINKLIDGKVCLLLCTIEN